MSSWGCCTLKRDIDKAERVQRRTARMVRELESISYKDKLKAYLAMFSLEKR